MPSYVTNDPKGWCGNPSRGAALGRPSYGEEYDDAPVKLHLSRVRLNQGGYDRLGTYFGVGAPLWWVANDDGGVDYVFRALDRKVARAEARKLRPEARFYR